MTPEQRNDLRQRVIDKMPKILELLACEHRPIGRDSVDDFRFFIILRIKEIAELTTTRRFEAIRAIDRVAANVRRLESSLKKLPPSARRLVAVEVKGIEDARMLVTKETGRTEAKRKRRLLAAEAAFDLIADYGSSDVNLTASEPYVRLANLLYLIATGKRGDMRKSCGQHFANRKKEGGADFYSYRRGPRGKRDPDDLPTYLLDEKYLAESKRERQRRLAAIKKWPPLAPIVERVLGS